MTSPKDYLPRSEFGLHKNTALLNRLKSGGARDPTDPYKTIPPDHPYTQALIKKYEFENYADEGGNVTYHDYWKIHNDLDKNLEKERKSLHSIHSNKRRGGDSMAEGCGPGHHWVKGHETHRKGKRFHIQGHCAKNPR